MALVIEDGSEVAAANSYTTDAEFAAYALARGYTIPSTEALRDELQVKAVDYLEGLEAKYQGTRASSTQVLAFPRHGLSLHGFILSSDVIPTELKNAQMELAFQLSTEEILINETVNNLVGFDVKGVYSESYGSGGSSQSIRTRKADAYLSNLLKNPNRLIRA